MINESDTNKNLNIVSQINIFKFLFGFNKNKKLQFSI